MVGMWWSVVAVGCLPTDWCGHFHRNRYGHWQRIGVAIATATDTGHWQRIDAAIAIATDHRHCERIDAAIATATDTAIGNGLTRLLPPD
jgi:hypothetical protein